MIIGEEKIIINEKGITFTKRISRVTYLVTEYDEKHVIFKKVRGKHVKIISEVKAVEE